MAIVSVWWSNIDICFVVFNGYLYFISFWESKIVIGFVVVPDYIALSPPLQMIA